MRQLGVVLGLPTRTGLARRERRSRRNQLAAALSLVASAVGAGCWLTAAQPEPLRPRVIGLAIFVVFVSVALPVGWRQVSRQLAGLRRAEELFAEAERPSPWELFQRSRSRG